MNCRNSWIIHLNDVLQVWKWIAKNVQQNTISTRKREAQIALHRHARKHISLMDEVFGIPKYFLVLSHRILVNLLIFVNISACSDREEVLIPKISLNLICPKTRNWMDCAANCWVCVCAVHIYTFLKHFRKSNLIYFRVKHKCKLDEWAKHTHTHIQSFYI